MTPPPRERDVRGAPESSPAGIFQLCHPLPARYPLVPRAPHFRVLTLGQRDPLFLDTFLLRPLPAGSGLLSLSACKVPFRLTALVKGRCGHLPQLRDGYIPFAV